ncbi:MAG: amino acid ABC transporter permease [Campylobacteraceae bacterium]
MKKKSTPLLENVIFGRILAIFILVALGFGLYMATKKIDYIWQWNSVPKYFAFQQEIKEVATFGGYATIKDNTLTLKSDTSDESKSLSLKEFTTNIKDGEYIYEGETLADKKEWRKGPILNGLIVTLKISALSIVIAFTIGFIMALMKISSYYFLRDVATVYITIIRGTPLLVQIFLFYFIIANIFNISSFYAGALSLGIFFGAYIAEVLRGAIQSIDPGQYEAAKSLGMNKFDTMVTIIMPQALKRALPTLINEVISLVKDSSLVSVISITDLTKVGREIVANTFASFETWITIAGVYLIITLTLSVIGNQIEDRMKKQGGM